MSTLKERVEQYFEYKKNGTLNQYIKEARNTFEETMDALEAGEIRTAEKKDNQWQVNEWVKKGILLGFALGKMKVFGSEDHFTFLDKDTFPVRQFTTDTAFRVVPPSAAMRRGSYAGAGCVFMPPAYVNVGAYIGEGSMVESLAGSCCQVGKNCHISAGTVIGGVLDPIEATPVILGDHVLLGEGAGITQGTRLGNLVTIAPGVHLSKATPVMDPIKGVAYTKDGVCELEEVKFGDIRILKTGKIIQEKDAGYGPEIPAGALIIPGMTVSSLGLLKPVPVVAKYIHATSERAYALEDALRQ